MDLDIPRSHFENENAQQSIRGGGGKRKGKTSLKLVSTPSQSIGRERPERSVFHGNHRRMCRVARTNVSAVIKP